MNIYIWLGFGLIIILAGLPLLFEKHQTIKNYLRFSRLVIIIVILVLLISIFKITLPIAIIIGLVLFILLSRKTYAKKRGIIYISSLFIIFISMMVVSNILFKSNPKYVLKHLAKHPKSSSLHTIVNDENVISYQSDIPRPLASVVKIIIAIEYAYQVDDSIINPDTKVSLDDLAVYYIKDTDGGAHEAWLKEVTEHEQVIDNCVKLKDVAAGMMTYSSNANTDYLIDLLGINEINSRRDKLKLENHDDIIPLTGALVAVTEFKNTNSDGNWIRKLEEMTDNEFKELAVQASLDIKQQQADLSGAAELLIEEQRIWSDRLSKSTAADYTKLLNKITNNSFPEGVTVVIRELLEWPMEKMKDNKHYNFFGAKGGSTAFVMNQATYAETTDGTTIELTLLMDDLTLWQNIMMQKQMQPFIAEYIKEPKFRDEVHTQLENHQ